MVGILLEVVKLFIRKIVGNNLKCSKTLNKKKDEKNEKSGGKYETDNA